MTYLQARAREYLSQTYFGGQTVATKKGMVTRIKYWEPPAEKEARWREKEKKGQYVFGKAAA